MPKNASSTTSLAKGLKNMGQGGGGGKPIRLAQGGDFNWAWQTKALILTGRFGRYFLKLIFFWWGGRGKTSV